MAGCRTSRISQRACECHQQGEGNNVIFISTLKSALSQQQGPVVVIELCYLKSLQQERRTSYSSSLFPVTRVCSSPLDRLKTCTQVLLPLLSCSCLASQFQKWIVHSSFISTTTVSLVIVLLLFIFLFASLFPALLRGKSPLNGELHFFENATKRLMFSTDPKPRDIFLSARFYNVVIHRISALKLSSRLSGSDFALTSNNLISVSCDVEHRDESRDRGSLLTGAVS